MDRPGSNRLTEVDLRLLSGRQVGKIKDFFKSFLLWELAKFKDSRVIQPVLAFLPKVQNGVLPQNDDLRTAYALENAFTTLMRVCICSGASVS